MFGHIQANLSVSITVKAMNHFRNFIISPSKIMSDDHLFYVICCDIPFSHFCTSNSDKLKIDIGQNYLQIILTEKRRMSAKGWSYHQRRRKKLSPHLHWAVSYSYSKKRKKKEEHGNKEKKENKGTGKEMKFMNKRQTGFLFIFLHTDSSLEFELLILIRPALFCISASSFLFSTDSPNDRAMAWI